MAGLGGHEVEHRHRTLWAGLGAAALPALLLALLDAIPPGGPGRLVEGLLLAGTILGAVALCAAAWRLLRQSHLQHIEELRQLRTTAYEAEATVHEQRELLHEMGSTLAGIASAAEVVRTSPGLPALRRLRLERMLEAEVCRLIRLLDGRDSGSGDPTIDVDEVLGTIVLSHQTRGEDVRWSPSGLVAACQADDLAEVLNILLDNAARHAPGAPVAVTVSAEEGMVEIVCADLGPGIPADLRGDLFESGARGLDSPGQGLGLSIARRLLAEQGGALDVLPTSAGATFVASVPEPAFDDGRVDVVAHAS